MTAAARAGSGGGSGAARGAGSGAALRGTCIGVDVGGTFTDLVVWSEDGAVTTCKTLSTPKDPSIGVLDALRLAARRRGVDLETFASGVGTIVHGTTVTTNAILTRRGARMGLLTTEGVRDALEMRRGIRERQYDNRYPNAVPLVPRYRRRPVRGRMDREGGEVEPLRLEDVRDAVDRFRRDGMEAVAICFLHSYANADHERRAAEIVREGLPGAFVSVSSEVLPAVRFYERVSTTVLDAYVGPILRDYLGSLTSKLAGAGFHGVLLVMQSNGGVALPEVVRQRPATTLLSGPAAGPHAAAAAIEGHGLEDAVVADMGGTSFDASLVRGGAAAMMQEGTIERLRIALPMLAITTIGAGGGSIGRIDEGGLLRMGPQSAGAAPGPACYGRGGTHPTCTDANLLLGYLDPEDFAGGAMQLRPDLAREAVRRGVAEPLGLSVEEAAAGMIRVIDTNMAHGVREITVRRGLDPREFPLVIAGGAGGLHACHIARELDIRTIFVPAAASVLCAAGMLQVDLQHDFVRSYVTRLGSMDRERLRSLTGEMIEEGSRQLALEGVGADRAEHRVMLDLRYAKQYHEVTVEVSREAVERGDVEGIARDFHGEHDRLYGYELSGEGTELELIHVRVRSIGRVESPELPRVEEGGEDPGPARKGSRRAFAPGAGRFEEVAIYDGHRLRAGNRIEGPALVERRDTTVLVSESFVATVDPWGSLRLGRREAQGGAASRGAVAGGADPGSPGPGGASSGGTAGESR